MYVFNSMCQLFLTMGGGGGGKGISGLGRSAPGLDGQYASGGGCISLLLSFVWEFQSDNCFLFIH